MSVLESSEPSTPNVSEDVKNICEKFAGFSRESFSYAEYHTHLAFELGPRQQQWIAREDARWLIIRKALKDCRKRGISAGDICRLMEVQGVYAHHGLFDLLSFIGRDWSPADSVEVTDRQWLAGWDIEFCRATGDWTLVHFTLGLLHQAAEFHGQLTKPAQIDLMKVALAAQGLYPRVAEKLGLTASHVRKVALGKRKSAKVSAALTAEIGLIESLSQGQADGAHGLANRETKPPAAAHESIQSADPISPTTSPRPRISLRVHSEVGGDVWAVSTHGSMFPIQIARAS